MSEMKDIKVLVLLFAVSVFLASCTTVQTQSSSSSCPVAGSLNDVTLIVTRCDDISFDISWQMSNYCEEGECRIRPAFICNNTVYHSISIYDFATSQTYAWFEENECTISGCYTNVSAEDQWFAIRPEVSVIREAESCNIVTVLPTNVLTATPSTPSSDIDECEEDIDGCSQMCINTDESFFCSCLEGYSLNEDQFTCSGASSQLLLILSISATGGGLLLAVAVAFII